MVEEGRESKGRKVWGLRLKKTSVGVQTDKSKTLI
jgi:hypothetical protein